MGLYVAKELLRTSDREPKKRIHHKEVREANVFGQLAALCPHRRPLCECNFPSERSRVHLIIVRIAPHPHPPRGGRRVGLVVGGAAESVLEQKVF